MCVYNSVPFLCVHKAEQELRKPVPPLLLSTEEQKVEVVQQRLLRVRRNVRRISPAKERPSAETAMMFMKSVADRSHQVDGDAQVIALS